MPCWEIRLVSVKLKAKNKSLILKTLEELHWQYQERNNNIYVRQLDGTMNLEKEIVEYDSRRSHILNQFNRKYSEVCLISLMKKKRWALKRKSENKFVGVKY